MQQLLRPNPSKLLNRWSPRVAKEGTEERWSVSKFRPEMAVLTLGQPGGMIEESNDAASSADIGHMICAEHRRCKMLETYMDSQHV
jgi:hypothetical protein